MPDDILLDLSLEPADALCLSPHLRDRLVHFLLRWKNYAALEACLTELIARRPLQVLLDARADMLLDQGRLAAAWDTMCQRHERSASTWSRIRAGRIHLAQHDADAALQAAQALVRDVPDSSMAWGFLGEVHLAAGDDRAAVAAYRRVNELAPNSRAYLLGMVSVYQARGDWVTASAYAVRLQESATLESPLPVTCLRRLRDYFTASKEWNHVTDIKQELDARHAAELSGLKEALVLELGDRAARRAQRQGRAEPIPTRRQRATKVAVQPTGPAPPPDSFESVLVSAPERNKLKEAARRLFGFADLLPGQAEIMACVLRGEDVLAVLPTGGGKSLCYQLPALLDESGTTLVISPLIALMKDQVDKLPGHSAALATTINSSLEGDELRRRLEGVRGGRYRLVYAAPERLRQPPFLHALRQARLNRLVVDEVHCVSMWGHDFRPDYLYIAEARQRLGHPPLLAMTATAPPRVRLDIVQRLGDMRVIAGDVLRSNLHLEVFRAHDQDEKLQYFLTFCRHEPGAGIVYAGTRKRCEELAELLRSQGIAAIHYHAGIDNRAAMQDEFMTGRARIVVATIAFGMGIDKPDIRFILHYEPSASIEAYYQEAGRAGRDGLPARCVLLYASSDRAMLARRARRDALAEDFLRQTYAAIKSNLQGARVGRVVIDDLRRDLQAEETPVRVAVSALEQAGLLRRGPDLPRTVSLRLKGVAPQTDADLAVLGRTCGLQPGQVTNHDPLDVAQRAGLEATGLEERLLAWSADGFLECRASARDPLLELLPAPPDSRERIRTLLEQYEQVQAQRVAEIVAYANTRRCRHGHISAYLGGRAIRHCASCDNCQPQRPQQADGDLPDESAQLQVVLQAAAHGWGRRNLVAILRGEPQAPPSARGTPGFGALSFRSEGALGKMLDRLQQRGFLQAHQLEHGGFMLQLTATGRRALTDPSALRPLAQSGARSASRKTTPQPVPHGSAAPADVSALPDDDPLFARLRAWRLEKAREAGLSAFLIAHNSLLRNIAAARPQSERELLAIKGMGPRKLEQYGPELLRLVREDSVHEKHEGRLKDTK
jgi:ATP-dependent DNA helicase RecQ